MIVVSDTSPISFLIKIHCLDLLPKLFGKVIIPKAVGAELKNWKSELWISGMLENSDWLEVREVIDLKKVEEFKIHLDDGEAEALELAIEIGADYVLIDEVLARREAKRLKIRVVGLIGILKLAKEKVLLHEVRPHLDELRKAGFWISEKLYEEILISVNE